MSRLETAPTDGAGRAWERFPTAMVSRSPVFHGVRNAHAMFPTSRSVFLMAASRRTVSAVAIRAALTRYPEMLLRRAARAFRRLSDVRDREAMHDFRVALRRLRTWLRFGVAKDGASRTLARALSELARDTNRARDLEIELDWLLARRSACASRRRVALDALIRARRTELRRTNAQVRRELAARWPALQREAWRCVATVRPRGAAALARAGAKLLKALRSIRSRRDGAALHRARIRAKRVRYLLEPLRVADARVAAAVAALVRIQDDFGNFHDRETIRDALYGAAAQAGRRGAGNATTTLMAQLDRIARAEQRALFEHCKHRHLRGRVDACARQLRQVVSIVRRVLRARKPRIARRRRP
jgi:CHAD domain-containing protein